MVSSTQSNPLSDTGTYWMSSGIPFYDSFMNSNGMWDGTKWIQDSSNGTSGFGSGVLGSTTNSGISSSAPEGFGLGSTGFGGAFNDSAVAGIGQQGALSGLSNAATSTIGNAALSGAMVGGITNSVSNGLSTAVAGIANPASMAGMLSGMAYGALGIQSSPAVGVLTGLASMVSPGLGLAVGILGPGIVDGVMDALDARDMENTKDYAEDLAGSYVGGRVAGSHISNALANDLGLSTSSKMGTITDAYADLGINNMGAIQGALEAAYSDLGFSPEVASVSAMADVVGQGISDITSSYGVGFGSQQANAGVGLNGMVDSTVDSLGLSAGFGQIGTTAQGPSAASTSIGQGVSEQAEAAGVGPSASPDAGPTADTSSTEGPSADTSSESDSSSSDGGEGGDGGGGGDGGDAGGDSGADSGTGDAAGDSAGSDSDGSDGGDDD